MSVSPVTRAATKPITTAIGTATIAAHHGIWNSVIISTTTIGPSITKPAGNHQPGHSIASMGSVGPVLLRKIPVRPDSERATLRQSSANEVRPAATRIEAPGHTVQPTIAL